MPIITGQGPAAVAISVGPSNSADCATRWTRPSRNRPMTRPEIAAPAST
jgi:hypothetical protein